MQCDAAARGRAGARVGHSGGRPAGRSRTGGGGGGRRATRSPARFGARDAGRPRAAGGRQPARSYLPRPAGDRAATCCGTSTRRRPAVARAPGTIRRRYGSRRARPGDGHAIHRRDGDAHRERETRPGTGKGGAPHAAATRLPGGRGTRTASAPTRRDTSVAATARCRITATTSRDGEGAGAVGRPGRSPAGAFQSGAGAASKERKALDAEGRSGSAGGRGQGPSSLEALGSATGAASSSSRDCPASRNPA